MTVREALRAMPQDIYDDVIDPDAPDEWKAARLREYGADEADIDRWLGRVSGEYREGQDEPQQHKDVDADLPKKSYRLTRLQTVATVIAAIIAFVTLYFTVFRPN